MPTKIDAFHTGQLWIGNTLTLTAHVYLFFKKLWCPHASCNNCIVCKQIETHQHPSFLWFDPAGYYTLETIQPILNTIRFARNRDEPLFFVLNRADFLSSACANALLKSLEEPPDGYYFLLLAERKELMLPTVISRCVISYKNEKNESIRYKELLACFTQPADPLIFLKELEKSKINEAEVMDFIDQLLQHFIIDYKKAIRENDLSLKDDIEQRITCLKKASSLPPMPGSSKIFLKNLFFSFL